MRRILFIVLMALTLTTMSFAQSRGFSRGAAGFHGTVGGGFSRGFVGGFGGRAFAAAPYRGFGYGYGGYGLGYGVGFGYAAPYPAYYGPYAYGYGYPGYYGYYGGVGRFVGPRYGFRGGVVVGGGGWHRR